MILIKKLLLSKLFSLKMVICKHRYKYLSLTLDIFGYHVVQTMRFEVV